MARKKAHLAEKAVQSIFPEWAEADKDQRRWALQRLLCGIRHLADREGMVFSGIDAGAARHHLQDVCSGEGAVGGNAYRGWDRIHDDNKAEGRPIGGQWSDGGVDYSLGFKVHRGKRA